MEDAGIAILSHTNRKGEGNVRGIHICDDAASYARLHQTRAGFPRPSMTNPCLHDMVKIGYASDVEARRKQLSTTALPFEYEIYATYETSGQLDDKKLHELIDTLNPKLRLAKNREFFAMSAEKAYRLLEAIAIISGSADKLKRMAQRQGETTSLSPLAEKLRNVSAIQGTSVFTYNGKKITDIAEETQWKKEDTLSETETETYCKTK